ncbi:MAG: hypothetical protein MJZ61_07950 [Bacteroidales bacterium]|nr:hypothetical protein [Bacteroidales bacterium]
MENLHSPQSTYRNNIERLDDVTKTLARKVRNSNLMRGVSFIGGASLAIVAANYSLSIMWSVIAVSAVAFLFFVKKNSTFRNLLSYNEALLAINQNELKSLEGDNSSFDGGNNFIDKSHNFSYDIDIFGENSIFQKINRTVTQGGRNKLAETFMNPPSDIKTIQEIQKDSQLFENEVDSRQDFMAFGKIMEGDFTEEASSENQNPEFFFTQNMGWKIAAILLSASAVFSIFLTAMDLLSPFMVLIPFSINIIITIIISRKTSTLTQRIDKYSRIYKKYGKFFDIIEKITLKPDKYKHISDKKISKALGQLSNIAALYEQRHNIVIIMFGQGLICYDLWVNMKFENWLRKNNYELNNWLNIVYDYDFMFSLANLKFNNPDYHYPTPVEGSFVLEASNAGHPLISPEKCVRNDIKFSNCNFITILTGANMAGKSTYLRTIGTNLILAHIGAVVCADSFVFSPTKMITSIRTNDSVQDSESYFFAELKRLRKIVERLESGETIFIIVDEMLRGTNSKDKHDGSQKFIEKLLKYNCYGIFATHDIDIGNMQESYPKNVNAKCFEISFEGDNLIFDYKIKDGISKNLNASFLMKKMGIIE